MSAIEYRPSAMRALAARLDRAWPHRRITGPTSIWILSGAMLATAIVLFVAGAGADRTVLGSVHLPFWALLLGFAAGERFVVHLHFRHSAHSISFGEIPLVFGLLFAPGHDVILAATIARLVVIGVQRKLPPIRLAFNLGAFLLWSCLAVLVFHAVTGQVRSVDPAAWIAAALAAAAASVVTALLISTAVSLSVVVLHLRQIVVTVWTDLAAALATTSVGLCAARLVTSGWTAAVLMAVPAVAMFVTFRAYVTERQRHERLEFLYEAARTLSRAPEIGPALERLLAQALEAFRAEVAELILLPPDGSDALRTTVRAQGTAGMLEAVELEIGEELRALVDRQGVGASPLAAIADGRLAEYLESRDLSDGLFTVLRGERSCIGAMMLGNPSGVVHTFSDDDLRLFETLGNNTSVALENDRLGQTVWRLSQLQRELEHQASHDPLTDLANRALFAAQVAEALNSDSGRVSVVFIDIDDFKTVNDSLGHAAGDELLIAVARRLSDSVRPSDVVARLGGDEFAILLETDTAEGEAVEIAERIMTRLAERFAVAGQNISVRVSAGIASGTRSEVSAEELIRNADVAMYRAKQAGKNGFQIFETGMEAPIVRRHALKQRLRDAAAKDESFVVHYQPIAALDTGEVVACEALVRWLDGPRGPVAPGSFIPIAEEMGVIVPIGRSVLRRACLDASRWEEWGAAPSVHVNLSLVELRDRGFLDGVTAALDRSGL